MCQNGQTPFFPSRKFSQNMRPVNVRRRIVVEHQIAPQFFAAPDVLRFPRHIPAQGTEDVEIFGLRAHVFQHCVFGCFIKHETVLHEPERRINLFQFPCQMKRLRNRCSGDIHIAVSFVNWLDEDAVCGNAVFRFPVFEPDVPACLRPLWRKRPNLRRRQSCYL